MLRPEEEAGVQRNTLAKLRGGKSLECSGIEKSQVELENYKQAERERPANTANRHAEHSKESGFDSKCNSN